MKDTIDKIPIHDGIGHCNTLCPSTHTQNNNRAAYLSHAHENTSAKRICPDCYNTMLWDNDGQAFVCINPKCEPRKGLKYDWSIPESAKVRQIHYRQEKEQD